MHNWLYKSEDWIQELAATPLEGEGRHMSISVMCYFFTLFFFFFLFKKSCFFLLLLLVFDSKKEQFMLFTLKHSKERYIPKLNILSKGNLNIESGIWAKKKKKGHCRTNKPCFHMQTILNGLTQFPQFILLFHLSR